MQIKNKIREGAGAMAAEITRAGVFTANKTIK
jgi:hypothetical protein